MDSLSLQMAQAALAHARTPKQEMMARLQLQQAKARQVAERSEPNSDCWVEKWMACKVTVESPAMPTQPSMRWPSESWACVDPTMHSSMYAIFQRFVFKPFAFFKKNSLVIVTTFLEVMFSINPCCGTCSYLRRGFSHYL
jgi:hypothetical protein